MSTGTVLLLVAAAYVLYRQGALRLPAGTSPLSRPSGPTYQSTAGGTLVNVPGIGAFRSGPGGTQVSVDAGFFDRLFGSFRGGTVGEGAQPSRAYLPEGSPALPSGTWQNVTDVTGGVWDAYRSGERDPALDIVNVPLDPIMDPAAFVPPDPGPISATMDPCEVDPSWCGSWTDGYEWVA